MMSYFGTDGIRGTFGQFPISPDFLLRLGFVAGKVLIHHSAKKDDHQPSVLIGKDTRLSGYVMEAALQAGFNAAGVDVYMLGVIPTPAIAHLVRSFHADMGVVISASHNPYQDNGVKFFSNEGKKISDAMQDDINSQLDEMIVEGMFKAFTPDNFDHIGKNHRIDDANGRYIEFCKGSFPYQYHLRGLTIALDCANGAGYSVAPRVFAELGASVVAFANTPNGININEGCGSTHPEALQQQVLQAQADVGIALDGDGDRIMMVDETGKLVDGDAILYILAMHADTKPLGVVGTLMSNMALEVALKNAGIEFARAKVGDRYVMQTLVEQGWVLGGESSGHILTLDKAGTGDGIVAGLQVLSVMARTGKRLSELTQGYTPMPQCLVNVRLTKKQDPYHFPVLVTKFEQAQAELGETGRLLIRQSGTEALIRVMVECVDEQKANRLAHALAEEVKAVMA